jgi:hypothetical protein
MFFSQYERDSDQYNKKFWEELQIEIDLGIGHIENTAFNSSSIVACVLIAAGTCLPSRCLVTAVSSGSTIPPFSRYITLLRQQGCSSI